MSEIYNLGTPHYYAVAVAHQRDNSSELVSKGINNSADRKSQINRWIFVQQIYRPTTTKNQLYKNPNIV